MFFKLNEAALDVMAEGDMLIIPEESLPNPIEGLVTHGQAEIFLPSMERIKAVVVRKRTEGLAAPDSQYCRKFLKLIRLADIGEQMFFTTGDSDVRTFAKGIVSNLKKSGIKVGQRTATVYLEGGHNNNFIDQQFKGLFIWKVE